MKTLPLVVLLAPVAWPNEALFEAARKGDVKGVRSALDNGADVNAKWRYDQTALLMAAFCGHTDMAKLLVERGADVDVKDSFYGMTPLAGARTREAIPG